MSNWGATLIALALSGCAWFDAKQRELIYRPTPGILADWQPITAADQPLWLSTGGDAPQRLRALWIAQPDAQAPAVLYLHGTFRNVFQNRAKIAAIHTAGFAVLAVDYRGWGESSATLPSEQSIVADAETAWSEFERRTPRAGSRVIYGHSMGSGVAVQLAWHHRAGHQFGALVLESAFTSMPDVARDRGGMASMLASIATQEFNSLARIDAITEPKWFIAGTADQTVPPVHSERLFAAATPPRTLVMIPGGGHSRLQEQAAVRYQATWRQIAATLQAAGEPAP